MPCVQVLDPCVVLGSLGSANPTILAAAFSPFLTGRGCGCACRLKAMRLCLGLKRLCISVRCILQGPGATLWHILVIMVHDPSHVAKLQRRGPGLPRKTERHESPKACGCGHACTLNLVALLLSAA